jgi:hypothetical protein
MRLTDPSITLVARTIAEHASESTFMLSAYWLAVTGDRKDYAARLTGLLDGALVLIVKERFDNANSIMTDLARILEQNRAGVLAAFEPRPMPDGLEHPDPKHLSIVLLARNELAVVEGSSPVLWPEWVPEVGGTEVPCFITDITRRINVPLGEPEADVSKVNRALYKVEGALIRRLVVVTEYLPGSNGSGLFGMIQRRSDVSWLEFLVKARSGHSAVRNAESYRPSVRTGGSVVSRLWEIVQSRSGDDIDRAVLLLTEALSISNDLALDNWAESLFGILGRGRARNEPKPERFARSTLFTVSASCQYITCAAHGHEYPELPFNLVTAVVDDLYEGLANIESCVNRMPRAGARRDGT